jgi:cyclic pyranopterin phosphate synthase
VLEGIAAAERAGLAPLKLNCVVKRGENEDQIAALARHFRGTRHVVRFIEYMDVGTLNGWNLADVVPAVEILERLSLEGELVPAEPGYRGEVASRYRWADGSGEIGVIASVSQPFCGNCTRARLSADGQLYTCLFAARGRDLKTALRSGASDEELAALIGGVWAKRADRYSEERTAEIARGREKVEMFHIGG